MEQYLFQSILFQLLFLLAYEFFLKKETFFSYNRGYLLLTPILSLLLPLLKIEGLENIVPPETLVLLPEVIIGGAAETGATEGTDVAFQSSTNLWMLFYFVGVLVSLILFLKKYRVMKNLYRNRVLSNENGLRIIEVPNSSVAFTFLNTIFLGEELSEVERKQILSHELVHVNQKHSVDLLFFEIFRILFWFNPLVYIYQARISTLHEFIADAKVVKTCEKNTYYQQLLNTAFNTRNISFINQFFNQSLIKKRIVMLQKSKSKSIAKGKFLLVVPLMLAMLTYVSCSNEINDDSVQSLEEIDRGEILELRVQNVNSLSTKETAKRNEIIGYLGTEGNPSTLILTDGKTSKRIFIDNNPGTPPPLLSGTTGNSNDSQNADVPFAIIEEVPVFPGCESLASNTEKKECMSEKITTHVNANFNTALGKELGLEGLNKIYVQFKITASGSIEVMGARAPAPELEEEAKRVVLSLPKMIPGKQKGENVGVLYSLPIVFNVPQ